MVKLSVLTAGGCHVAGYPIEKQHSFPNILGDLLGTSGLEVENTCLSHVTFAHGKRLVSAAMGRAPHVLVLQLGNYETIVTFRHYLAGLIGWHTKRSRDHDRKLAADSRADLSLSWKLKCAIKMRCDRILRHPLVNFQELRTLLPGFFQAVAVLDLPQVIVLSPLPCADPLYLSYRSRLGRMMKREAELWGFEYIDFLGHPGRRDEIFVDPTHLNRLGHELVASALAKAILGANSPRGLWRSGSELCRVSPQ